MKIANCKYCGTQAKMCTDSNGTHIYCPDCLQDDEYTADVLDCVQQDAIDTWNDMNTDQHGQQLNRQVIDWVEWDGDVEHLPPTGTRIYYRAPSEINGKPCVCAGEWKVVRGYPCVCFWRCSGEDGTPKEEVHIWIKKGDMFAIID